VIPAEVMREAAKWFYELETTDNLDRIWPAFDDWFEASETHRDAYEVVRRRHLKALGLPDPYWTRRFRLKLRMPKFCWANPDGLEHQILLLVVAVALILAIR
jgi:ferric-dicitrate binding protein FerR (iron transport regulator)